MTRGFYERLKPAPVGGGFALEDYWVWCGSVLRGEDGRYHMFAARWPKTLSFWPHYFMLSEVVHATADTPEGPYEFQEVALPARGEGCWDGRMTHNPTIHKWGDTYLLYYIGATFGGPLPTPATPVADGAPLVGEIYRALRIGLATAKSLDGPWERRDAPILEPRPGRWDGALTTNPSPCVLPDGSVLLMYRSQAEDGGLLHLGLARAEHFEGPYERLSDEPVLNFDAQGEHVEDPCLWWEAGQFHVLCKDLKGGLSGERGAGVYATSPDALHWTLADPPRSYARTVRWEDGTQTTLGQLERPQVLMQDGRSTHLFLAAADGPGGFNNATRTWNLVIPLGGRI